MADQVYNSIHTGQQIDAAVTWLQAHAADLIFGGVVSGTTIAVPDDPTYWFAPQGTYTCGGSTTITISSGNLGIITYDGTQWSSISFNVSATPIVNDLITGGDNAALSAEMGKLLKAEIGNILISRWSGVPDGRYFGTAVGGTVNKNYPSSNANFNVYMTPCAKGDRIVFGTKTGYNTQPWLVCDSSMKVLAVGAKYDSNTPKALDDLVISQDNAAYLIINSIGTTDNYISGGSSVIKRIITLEHYFSDDIYKERKISIKPLLLKNCCFVSNGLIVRGSFTSIAYILDLRSLNVAQVQVPVANGYYIHFEKSDGTLVLAHDNSSLTHRVVTLDVPSDVVAVRGTIVSNQTQNWYVITNTNLDRYLLKGEEIAQPKDNRDSLLPIVETTKTGRFAFDTVGVMDYLNAFDELSYTFPDFVKQTKIGDSQEPLSTKSDQNTYPINRYTYTKSGASPTKKFVFAGGLHGDSEGWTNNGGDSPQNIITLYFFLQDLLMHCNDDPFYKKLTDTYVIEVLPVMNPWGVQNHSRYNGRDVDLNRNFDHAWEESTDAHKGSSACSEAESQAIQTFINGLVSNGGFERYIEVHSRGEVLIASDNRFFGVTSSTNQAKDSAASYYMIGKYGGQGGFSNEAGNYGGLWCWINFELNIPACDVECCQSLHNDRSTRHSKLLNLQMTDYVKWSVLMQLEMI